MYPYLLRGMAITRPNQVWSTDITYVRLPRGFVYNAKDRIRAWIIRLPMRYTATGKVAERQYRTTLKINLSRQAVKKQGSAVQL